MFEQEVTTLDGHVKRVVAWSEEQLAEAVAVAQMDRLAPSPDIDNPAHGNVVVSQFTGDMPAEVPADPEPPMESEPPAMDEELAEAAPEADEEPMEAEEKPKAKAKK